MESNAVEQPCPPLEDTFAKLAVAALIVLVALNVSTLLMERVLDWEEYRILDTVDGPLREHMAADIGYGAYHKLSHWLSYRVFNGHVIGLRFPALLTAVLSVIAVWMLARWRFREPAVVATAVGVFGLGWFFLDYARWGITGYSAATLFYVATFYLFWRISEERLSKLDKALAIAFVSFGIFILFHTLVAMVVGVVAVLARQLVLALHDKAAWTSKLKGLAWLLGYPILALAVYVPFILVPRLRGTGWVHDAEEYKPYLYFAHQETFEKTVSGAVQFYAKQAYTLFEWLLRPVGEFGATVAPVFVALLALGFVFSFLPSRIRSPRFFVAVYVVVALLALVLGNMLQAYPFGNPRYAFFLHLPAVMLVAYGVQDILAAWDSATNNRARRVVRVCGVGALCALAAFVSLQEANRRLEAGERVTRALGMMRAPYDRMLVEPRYEAMVETMAPESQPSMQRLTKDKSGFEQQPPIDLLTVTRRPLDVAHKDFLHELAKRYVSLASVDLHDDRQYEVFFHKYNVHLESWRLREAALDDEATALPVKFGFNPAHVTDDGTLRLRGWILTPETIDRVEVSIAGSPLEGVEYPVPRPDVAQNYPQYLIEQPGFELEASYEAEYAGEPITLRFYAGDTLVYEREIEGVTP